MLLIKIHNRRESFALTASRLFRYVILIVSGISTTLLSACAQPYINDSFGNAVRLSVAQQNLNSDAARVPRSVNGMDGASAHETLDRYRKSFKEPAPHPSVFTIGISGSGGGG